MNDLMQRSQNREASRDEMIQKGQQKILKITPINKIGGMRSPSLNNIASENQIKSNQRVLENPIKQLDNVQPRSLYNIGMNDPKSVPNSNARSGPNKLNDYMIPLGNLVQGTNPYYFQKSIPKTAPETDQNQPNPRILNLLPNNILTASNKSQQNTYISTGNGNSINPSLQGYGPDELDTQRISGIYSKSIISNKTDMSPIKTDNQENSIELTRQFDSILNSNTQRLHNNAISFNHHQHTNSNFQNMLGSTLQKNAVEQLENQLRIERGKNQCLEDQVNYLLKENLEQKKAITQYEDSLQQSQAFQQDMDIKMENLQHMYERELDNMKYMSQSLNQSKKPIGDTDPAEASALDRQEAMLLELEVQSQQIDYLRNFIKTNNFETIQKENERLIEQLKQAEGDNQNLMTKIDQMDKFNIQIDKENRKLKYTLNELKKQQKHYCS